MYPAAATLNDSAFQFGGDREANELTSWITLDRAAFTLEPWGQARVRATITVPPDASPGERYGVLWAATASAPRATASASSATGEIKQVHRVGVRMYLDIGPGGEPASDFTIGDIHPARGPEGEPSITAQVTNTGGRAVDLTGTVTLTDGPAGSQAGPFPIQQGVTLAPGHSGQVIARLPVELPNGPWKAEVNLESGLVKRSVTVQVQFPDPGQVGTRASVVSRVVSAWSIGAGIVVVLLSAGLVLAFRLRRHPAGQRRERVAAGR
ncbi:MULTISPECIES: hypothetical protein [Micromonospora]|uniref:hypothetical protein n=1 Tax=Micromonospora TaxID=1873 RepID=UPI0006AEF924|nr:MULTISPECIES: hypothetical protein [Micromonospora]NJC15878.1 hypothetical protein [Micromonospora profundi]